MGGLQKDYILFDLDGTLTNPKEGITKSVAYALASFGIEEDPDRLTRFIGPPLREAFQEYYGFSPQQAEAAVVKYRERFAVQGLYENEVYPGIAALLERLRAKGEALVVATSKPTVFARKILDHFALSQYFVYIAGAELGGVRSRKGEVIAYAMEQAGIASGGAAVMVGDRLHDVRGAQENGMESVGVLYGFGSREELEEAGADYIVNSVAALRDLLL